MLDKPGTEYLTGSKVTSLTSSTMPTQLGTNTLLATIYVTEQTQVLYWKQLSVFIAASLQCHTSY